MTTWNEFISCLPYTHVLQTYEWGQIKATIGWHAYQYYWVVENDHIQMRTWLPDAIIHEEPIGAAQVLERKVQLPLSRRSLKILYVTKGPLIAWEKHTLRNQVLADLSQLARKRGAIFIKVDPDVSLGTGYPGQPGSSEDAVGNEVMNDLNRTGWRSSKEQIQFCNTVILDLSPNDEALLMKMKEKTRYNIRLASRKGVIVRIGSDTDLTPLFRLYAQTAIRDNFVIRDEEYYYHVWRMFMNRDLATPLVAEVDGEIIAGLILFHFSRQAWYLYGMSSNLHREKMPNYLLQWEAIRHAKALGCLTYDLWGAPDNLVESDPLWGVYRFKEGFGGRVIRTIGAWDFPTNHLKYRIYTEFVPHWLELMRRRGKAQTRNLYNQ